MFYQDKYNQFSSEKYSVQYSFNKTYTARREMSVIRVDDDS